MSAPSTIPSNTDMINKNIENNNDNEVAVDTLIDFKVKCHSLDSGSEDADADSDVNANDDAVLDMDRFYYADYRIEQYAHSVLDFSSQYGMDLSISYTASNITGRPSKFPEYGDFPQTYAMRTYGEWWNKAPSHEIEIQPQNLPKIPAEDFIVLYFEDYLLPEGIAIFETFNPGAVIRIWAYTITKNWVCLWEIEEFNVKPNKNLHKARCFVPPLKKIKLPTKTIRLEFNHQHLDYYTEIDAVLLSGRKFNTHNMEYLLNYHEHRNKSSILCKLHHLRFRPTYIGSYQERLQEFLTHDLNKFLSALSDKETKTASKTIHQEQLYTENQNGINKEKEKVEEMEQCNLKDMPFDILLKIFSYLDMKSLFRVGKVSRFFYDVSNHPLLYSEINLKPYWHLATTELVATLAKRATVLRKLDVSWCGCTVPSLSPTEFKKFIQQRGDTLTHLRLNSAKFLNATCIETLGIVCDNLRELSLRSCPPLLNFSCLANLKYLERLDFYQTYVEADLLLIMLENNPKLKHLNLAYCNVAVNMDEVAHHLSKYNGQLISLDMWKAHFLTANGLLSLAQCPQLEEVDFGWCLREGSLGDSLKIFLSQCTKIKKLFLAAVRGLTDRDLEYIAKLCPNLEQLDIMGVLSISKEKYIEILQKCTKLKLFDLSFCDNITDNEVSSWAQTFKVDIKCCHVPNEPR